MSLTELLLAVILLQQTLTCGVWLIAARLRLARRSAMWWAGSAALLSLSMGLILMRGQMPDLLSVAGGNLAMLAGLVSVRCGVQGFVRAPLTAPEHAAVLGIGGVGLVGSVVAGLGLMPVVFISGVLLAWTLGRTAQEIAQGLGSEFGAVAARWCAIAAGVPALMFGMRGVLAPLYPHTVGSSIVAGSASNTAVIFVSLGLGLVLNLMLVALVVMRLVLRLRHQSDHDALTGLLGRRALEHRLQVVADCQRRVGDRYAMLSVDIDHFKQINDRFGHAAGDAVLVRVAAALREASRQGDSVARIGGEEFCLLLPAVSSGDVQQVAERVLRAVRALRHPELGAGRVVTVSVGVAVAAPDEPAAALFRRVDRALYDAKAAGRDRIALAQAASSTRVVELETA